MREVLNAANSYPDDDCSQLRRKLAEHHGLPADQVLVAAGSTALLSLLCHTLLEPGLNAVTSERSFIVYSMAVRAAGARLVEAPMRSGEESFDLVAILAAIDANTRIVFLANPNNPTGTMVEAAAVERFLAQIPSHAVVVLDEAYYEFALHFAALRRVTYSNSLDYVRQGATAVVLRTFSKAHGLAPAHRLRTGPRRTFWLLLADARYIFCFVGRASCRAGSHRRPRPHSTRGGEQCCAVPSSRTGFVGIGISRRPHLGEFSVLRSIGRRCGFCQPVAGRRRGRASSGVVGCAELHTRDDRHARAEPGFPAGGAAVGGARFRGWASSVKFGAGKLAILSSGVVGCCW